MTKIIDCDLLDNRRIITSGLLLKRGDIRFCPYEVSFCLARLPRVEGVLKPSEMAAFAFPAIIIPFLVSFIALFQEA